MRIKAYIRCEPFKGYIPSDKVSYHGESFEKHTNALSIGAVRSEWMRTNKVSAFMRQSINDAINDYLTSREGHCNRTGKLFYINFNGDGVDVFESRTIWE